MSNPPPAGFQPPGFPYTPPPNRGPSCWAIGALGCLAIVILGGVLVFVFINGRMHTKVGRDFTSGFHTTLQKRTEAAGCVNPMTEIQRAIVRYHLHEGKYPDNLGQLKDKYLPPGVTLHCGVDPSDDPAHVTYEYIKPTEKSPLTAIVLRYSWPVTTTLGGQTTVQTTTEQITLGGTVSNTQSSSVTTLPAGHAPPR